MKQKTQSKKIKQTSIYTFCRTYFPKQGMNPAKNSAMLYLAMLICWYSFLRKTKYLLHTPSLSPHLP